MYIVYVEDFCWRYIDARTLLLHIFLYTRIRSCVYVCVCQGALSSSCRVLVGPNDMYTAHSTEKSKRICVSV